MFTGMLSLRSASQDSVAVRRVKSAGRGTPPEAHRLVAIRGGKRHASQRHDSLRGITLHAQARQDSNLQPPVLERAPSNAGVAAFVDSQGLSLGPPTPALLDNAGAGTNPGTDCPVRRMAETRPPGAV